MQKQVIIADGLRRVDVIRETVDYLNSPWQERLVIYRGTFIPSIFHQALLSTALPETVNERSQSLDRTKEPGSCR